MSTRERIRQKKDEYWTGEDTPRWANRWTVVTALLVLYALAGVAVQGFGF